MISNQYNIKDETLIIFKEFEQDEMTFEHFKYQLFKSDKFSKKVIKNFLKNVKNNVIQ